MGTPDLAHGENKHARIGFDPTWMPLYGAAPHLHPRTR